MSTATKFLKVLVAILASATAANADDAPLQSLDTWGKNRGWEGVGLLQIGQQATCTATLITPTLVLTAAHCMFDKEGQKIPPRYITFRAGWRDGKSVAMRSGQKALVHADYDPQGGLSHTQIRHDIALLQLSDPILSTHADPFRTDAKVRRGAEVSVVSYGAGRNNAPSRQRACNVLDAEKGILAMTCDVVPGSSGAPVFSTDSGQPRIVAMVSAIGRDGSRQVSFGMDIDAPLRALMKDFHAGTGVYPRLATAARRLTPGSGKDSSGARFIKP